MNTETTSDVAFRLADRGEIDRLVEIVQLAYRGGKARVAWKNEDHLVTGPRIDATKIEKILRDIDNSAILVAVAAGRPCGCVLVEKHGDDAHIGMLAVDPDYQNLKLGKRLVEAAEKHAAEEMKCLTGKMFVLSQREELLAWYGRLGYEATGESVPFPAEEEGSKPVDPQTRLAVIAKSL